MPAANTGFSIGAGGDIDLEIHVEKLIDIFRK